MDLELYRQNRAKFAASELAKHASRWVAFSHDGARIIASHEDLVALNDLIVATGEDPEQVALERIEIDDVFLGAAELR